MSSSLSPLAERGKRWRSCVYRVLGLLFYTSETTISWLYTKQVVLASTGKVDLLSSVVPSLILVTAVQLSTLSLVGMLLWPWIKTAENADNPWLQYLYACKTNPVYFRTLTIVGVANAIGLLATNIGYVHGSVGLVQLVKLAEPVTPFVVELFFINKAKQSVYSVIAATIIVVGATFAIAHEPTTNIVSLAAVSLSNALLPITRSLRKRLYLQHNIQLLSGLIVLSLVSFSGAMVLNLALICTLLISNARPKIDLHSIVLLTTSGLSYSGFGVSIFVSQKFDTVVHTALDPIRRVFAIIVSSAFLSKNSYEGRLWMGLAAAAAGLFLLNSTAGQKVAVEETRPNYISQPCSSKKGHRMKKRMGLLAFGVFAVVLNSARISLNAVTDLTQQKYSYTHSMRASFMGTGTRRVDRNNKHGSESFEIERAKSDEDLQHGTPPFTGEYVSLWTYPGPPFNDSLLFSGIENSPSRFYCFYSEICDKMVDQQSRTHDYEFLNLRQLTMNTTYEQYISGHMLYKVLQGDDFPHHVQSVAACSLFLKRNQLHQSRTQDMIRVCNEYDPRSPNSIPPFAAEFIKLPDAEFAAIGYDSHVTRMGAASSDEEVQSMAAVQFMPYVSTRIDRDQGFRQIENGASPLLIANTIYGNNSRFPPPESARDISFVSVELSGVGVGVKLVKNRRDYWRRYTNAIGPVGARDRATLSIFQRHGIPAYLSGDFTLMFNLPQSSPPLTDNHEVLVVDVVPSLLPEEVHSVARVLKSRIPDILKDDHKQRSKYAFDLLTQYKNSAKVVITSCVNTALPAIALGVPVIFVEEEPTLAQSRRPDAGISDLFHKHRAGDEWVFDLNKPIPPAPGAHQIDRHRAAHWNHLRKRSRFYVDAARLYGMIPMNRLGKQIQTTDLHDHFHFIYTTEASKLNWKMVRAIESVFFHHPNAHVMVHSSTLADVSSKLDVFKETGYNLSILSVDLPAMIMAVDTNSNKNVVEAFVASLGRLQQGRHWYSHMSDIIRFLVLYEFGGVYLDIDMYVQRPIKKTISNALGWQDSGSLLNGAGMIFEPGHPMVAEALDYVFTVYNETSMDDWEVIGPNLVTHLYQNSVFAKTVQILQKEAFQPIPFLKVQRHCFEGVRRYSLKQTLAIHLNNMKTSKFNTTRSGSQCDEILHQHCIFCDEIHTAQQ